MSKKKGRTLLVKIGDGSSPEVFIVLCALTTKSLTINNAEFDVTTADCIAPGGALWTEVMDGAKRVAVTGTGISKEEAAEKRLVAVAMASPPVANMQIIVPNFGTFDGEFFAQSAGLGGD